jgi:hypothetical protein
MFKDNGFEVDERYEKSTNTKLIREHSDNANNQERETLRAREQFKRLRSKWFSFLDETETWDNAEEKLDPRSNWIDGITKALTPFMRGTSKGLPLSRLLEEHEGLSLSDKCGSRLPRGHPG